MTKICIIPHKTPLDSLTELKRRLKQRILRVAPDSETHRYNPSNIYINWGCGQHPRWATSGLLANVYNRPNIVSIAANKLKTFQQLDLKEISTIEFTGDQSLAQKWVDSGEVVFGRSILTGSGGRGIVVLEGKGTEVPKFQLYTKYKKKRHEYRVHVFNGEVIDVQWKRKSSEAIEADPRIRNHDRGWVFCRENIVEPKDLRPLAITALKQLGLNFGAVDIIWNERENRCYFLEVNTAPGITGTTADNYAAALLKLVTK